MKGRPITITEKFNPRKDVPSWARKDKRIVERAMRDYSYRCALWELGASPVWRRILRREAVRG